MLDMKESETVERGVICQGACILALMKIHNLFNLRLKGERQRLGLTQEELAGAAGIDRRTQYKYEKGTNEPVLSYLKGVESAGMDVCFLLYGQRACDLKNGVDWPLVWLAVEDISLFAANHATQYPAAHMRDMTERLYEVYKAAKAQGPNTLSTRADRNGLLKSLLNQEIG